VLVLGHNERLCEILSQSKECAVHFLESSKVAPTSIPPTRDFDYVAVLDILHEVAKPVEIFIAARRALSRDGSIVVCCQNPTTSAITSAEPPRLSKRTVLKHVYEAGLIVVEFDKVGEIAELYSPTVRTGAILANPNDPASVGPREVDDELSSTHFILHTVPVQSHRHHQLMRLKETRFDRDLYELQSEVKRLSAMVNELRTQQPTLPSPSSEVPLHALEDKVDAFRKDIESAILMLANKLRPEALAALLKSQLPPAEESSATPKSIAARIRGLF
jgi:hypothetical protein